MLWLILTRGSDPHHDTRHGPHHDCCQGNAQPNLKEQILYSVSYLLRVNNKYDYFIRRECLICLLRVYYVFPCSSLIAPGGRTVRRQRKSCSWGQGHGRPASRIPGSKASWSPALSRGSLRGIEQLKLTNHGWWPSYVQTNSKQDEFSAQRISAKKKNKENRICISKYINIMRLQCEFLDASLKKKYLHIRVNIYCVYGDWYLLVMVISQMARWASLRATSPIRPVTVPLGCTIPHWPFGGVTKRCLQEHVAGCEDLKLAVWTERKYHNRTQIQVSHNTHVKLRRSARVLSICTSMPDSATRFPSCRVLMTKYGQLSMDATTNCRPPKSPYCCTTSGTTDAVRRILSTSPARRKVPAGTSLATRYKIYSSGKSKSRRWLWITFVQPFHYTTIVHLVALLESTLATSSL